MARSAPSPRRRTLFTTLALAAAVLLVATAGRRWASERPAPAVASAQPSLAMRAGAAPRTAPKRTMHASEAIVTERAFALFENDAVINVVPVPSIDPAGGFLVVDHRESQLRRYRADGTLLWHAGRKGDGPGEFRALIGAERLGNGDVAAVDRHGRITLFDAEGKSVLHTAQTTLSQITDVAVVRDSLLLLGGVEDGDPQGPRLHLVHPRSGELVRSFWAPFAGCPNEAAATFGGFTSFAIRGDSIAAIFGVSDTLYVFTVDGGLARQFPLRADSLRRVPREGPPSGTQMERLAWLTTFDLVADVHWLPDGFAVAYQSVFPARSFERQWHLLALTERGDTRLEVRHTPRLLTVAADGTFYFLDSESETPDRWIEARLAG